MTPECNKAGVGGVIGVVGCGSGTVDWSGQQGDTRPKCEGMVEPGAAIDACVDRQREKGIRGRKPFKVQERFGANMAMRKGA